MVDAATAAAGELDAKRFEVVAGDIGEPPAGPRSATTTSGSRRRSRHVFHLAAIYDLAVPLEIAQRVNVDGTGNVLDFCAAAKSLDRLLYVSTAYVAGMRTGVVYEHELVMGQDFKNHYESTKFQAEVWARDMLDRVPTTIVRPAIVVGDSQTGETQKFDGPYFILRTIAEAERAGRPVVQFGRADAAFNAVPVDFIVDAIVAAAGSAEAEGRDAASGRPGAAQRERTHRDARRWSTRGARRRAGSPRGWPRPRCACLPSAERLGGTPPESLAYLNHPVRFDTRRATQILEPLGVSAPNFREYAAAMVRFFREHEDDPSMVPGYRV